MVLQIFGHTGMKGGPGEGNTAEWADYPGELDWLVEILSASTEYFAQKYLRSGWYAVFLPYSGVTRMSFR